MVDAPGQRQLPAKDCTTHPPFGHCTHSDCPFTGFQNAELASSLIPNQRLNTRSFTNYTYSATCTPQIKPSSAPRQGCALLLPQAFGLLTGNYKSPTSDEGKSDTLHVLQVATPDLPYIRSRASVISPCYFYAYLPALPLSHPPECCQHPVRVRFPR